MYMIRFQCFLFNYLKPTVALVTNIKQKHSTKVCFIMAFTTSADITSHTNYEMLLSSPTTMQPRNLYCMRQAKNIAKKKLFQAHIILKLRQKVISDGSTTPCYRLCSKKVLPAPVVMPVAPLTTPYPYPLELSCPQAVNDWHPMNTPLFTIKPLPVIIPSPSTTFATHIYPFGGTVVQPVLTPIIPQTFAQDNGTNVSNHTTEFNFSSELIDGVTEVYNVKDTYYMQEETITELQQTNILIDENIETINIANVETQSDPLEVYLTLPKEVFPTARMLSLDPNAIIDEFCKMPNLQRHAPWILDLEFGIPRTHITRPLPIYNVKFNSIHCKNAPDAIHPAFESCTPDFKRALLFYYDCVISAWYRGYMMITSDRSVENFQSWLLLPTQVLGMCWP